MKNKFVNVVFKKFQSYSFIIFLALILVAFFVLAQFNKKNDDSHVGKTTTTNQPIDQNPTEEELFKLPLAAEDPQIARNIYDVNASVEDQIDAIIKVDNTYYTNDGVNYTIDGETEFDVLASLSGTVSRVSQDPLLGYLIEIEHLHGIKTVYFSLGSTTVAVGDKVAQGDVLGKAGTNNFDPDSGVHVHFEVLKGNVYLNPNDLIDTSISEFDNE